MTEARSAPHPLDPTDPYLREAQTFPRLSPEMVARVATYGTEERLPAGHDFVVVARSEAAEFAEREGLAGIKSELDELLEKAGPKR